jgi:hypothetical protein
MMQRQMSAEELVQEALRLRAGEQPSGEWKAWEEEAEKCLKTQVPKPMIWPNPAIRT